MHALLVTVGSAGDVHPFVGLGRALTGRGHRATLVTNAYFEPLARRAGLEFIDSSPDGKFYSVLNNPHVWHRFRGFGIIMREAVLPLLRPIYDIVAEHAGPDTVVVASSLALGARIAQEKLRVPLATVHLAPAVFRTDYDGPRLPGAALGARVPVALKRLQYWLADRVVIDRILAPAVNGFRAELGLPTQRRLLKDWWNSPQLVLGAFPEWFAPPQPDRPPQTVLTGFPLYDEGDLGEPSDEVREFIAAGGPPIAFTPGSANVHGREFFAVAVEACHRLGRRGVLLTRFPDQLPANLPNTVRHFDFVPFGWLLPRSAAVVHHGGIGSTAQGLAAGVPQLLMPLGFDQFDNAARIERLGCGDWLPLRRFTAANVTAVLARLLESPSVAEACRRTASLSRGQRALTAMCEAIERLGSATQRAIPGVA